MNTPTPNGDAEMKPTHDWTECEALVADYQMGEASFSDVCQRLFKYERANTALQARNEALCKHLKRVTDDLDGLVRDERDEPEIGITGWNSLHESVAAARQALATGGPS